MHLTVPDNLIAAFFMLFYIIYKYIYHKNVPNKRYKTHFLNNLKGNSLPHYSIDFINCFITCLRSSFNLKTN